MGDEVVDRGGVVVWVGVVVRGGVVVWVGVVGETVVLDVLLGHSVVPVVDETQSMTSGRANCCQYMC